MTDWLRIPDDPVERGHFVAHFIADSISILRDDLRDAMVLDGSYSPEAIDHVLGIAERKLRPVLEAMAAAAYRRGLH